jgi:2-polyprenyl-3-methyl-5-hydroxy-6-metoxy-1,4-benzoquinol methylase
MPLNNYPCRICGNTENNQEFIVKEMMFGLGDLFRYFQCSSCQCLQIKEFPEDIAKYYPSGYPPLLAIKSRQRVHGNKYFKRFFQMKRNEAALLGGDWLGKFLSMMFPLDENRIEKETCIVFKQLKRIGISFKSKILDVGSGTGSLLRSLQRLGFRYLMGVDPFINKNIDYGNGVLIRKAFLQDLDGDFDLIMFHHSFEHIEDPYAAMSSVSRMLRDKGLCLIRIPIVPSYAWTKYGIHWVQIDAPRHFFIHSVKSIELLTTRAGLTIKDIIYDSTDLQFLGSEQYLKGIPLFSELSYKKNPSKSMFSEEQIEYFEKEAERLNSCKQGDQAAFYITKVN